MDFYSLSKFGKTKIGQLVLYAKQAQKNSLIKNLCDEIKPNLRFLLKIQNIDAIGFIPPTVPRLVQFMKEFEHNLGIKLPKIDLKKAYLGKIPIPQKTLSRLEDRVENADKSIFVVHPNTKTKFENVLLIDDAVGSGATLNEVAKKLLQEKIAKKGGGLCYCWKL